MIVTSQQATKSTTMAMVQQDTTMMTVVMDVDLDNDNTASCVAAARRESEAVQIYAMLQPAGANEEGGSMMDA